eukprot:EG_transcript_21904
MAADESAAEVVNECIEAVAQQAKKDFQAQKSQDKLTWSNKGPISTLFFKLCDAVKAGSTEATLNDDLALMAEVLLQRITDLMGGAEIITLKKLEVKVKDWRHGGPRYSEGHASAAAQRPKGPPKPKPEAKEAKPKAAAPAADAKGNKTKSSAASCPEPMPADCTVGFFLFTSEKLPEVRATHPELSWVEQNREAFRQWRALTKAEKAEFEKRGQELHTEAQQADPPARKAATVAAVAAAPPKVVAGTADRAEGANKRKAAAEERQARAAKRSAAS